MEKLISKLTFMEMVDSDLPVTLSDRIYELAFKCNIVSYEKSESYRNNEITSRNP